MTFTCCIAGLQDTLWVCPSPRPFWICRAAVGHSLNVEHQSKLCSRFSAAQLAWSEVSGEETELALREGREGKGKSEAESCGRAQPAAPAHVCMPGERRREDPTSRSWSCKVKQQTDFRRPVPPAEQTTGLLSSAGHGPPRLPTPSPSAVLEPVL